MTEHRCSLGNEHGERIEALQAQLDTMAAALHRMADKLVAEQSAATESLRAMTGERDFALARARESERNSTDAITRAIKAEDSIGNEHQRARLLVDQAKAAAEEQVETARSYAERLQDLLHETRTELAAAYRATSALRRGVPRWLVPTCAAVGAAKDVADEWRDRASGLVVRMRRKARKAVGR